MKHTIVIGGGITGLAAAYYLRRTMRDTMDVTVIESSPRPGGKITTAREGGFVVEGGPDSFLARKTATLELCRELGLGDQLQPTRAGKYPTFVWSDLRLHPMPTGIKAMLRSRLISWPGKLRMGAEIAVPPRKDNGDESVGSFMRRRFGGEMLDKLAGPLMGGIYAADPETLSLESTFPFLPAMEKKHGSVLRGWLKRPRRGGKGQRSMFMTLRGGLLQLTEALTTAIGPEVIHCGTQVAAVLPRKGRYEVVLADGPSLHADNVVFATPAHITAELVNYIDSELAERLRAIRYVTTATVSLGFREEDLPPGVKLDGFGFVVPRVENRRINACSWSSTKFEGRAPEGHALLRVFVGGAGAEALAERSDEALVRLARQEVDAATGIGAEPVLARVYRWQQGNPQYEVGHRGRVAEIESLAETHRGLYLAGAAYHGAGVPDCIENAQAVVRQLAAKYGIDNQPAAGDAVPAAAH